MRQNHPRGLPTPFGNTPGQGPRSLPDASPDVLDRLVTQLDLQSSAGVSGWNARLLQLVYGQPSEDRPMRRLLQRMALHMFLGTAKGQPFLLSSRLVALQQGDKIRPIACGELFYRLCTRLILQVVQYDGALLPCQFGVRSKGGVEPAIEWVEQQKSSANNSYLYCLDFSNAFNCVSRSVMARAIQNYLPHYYRLAKWAYNCPSALLMSNDGALLQMESSEGLRQGDPLGPLFFSIAIRDRLSAIMTLTGPGSLVGYLDDLLIASNNEQLLEQIRQLAVNDGLTLNMTKSRQIHLQTDDGFEVLGTLLGSVNNRRAFITQKISCIRSSLKRLTQLPKQQALYLLRNCFARELSHLARCLDTSDLDAELTELDRLHCECVEHLAGVTEGSSSLVSKRIYTLPTNLGGFGLTSLLEVRDAARSAAVDVSRHTLRERGLIVPGDDDPEWHLSQRVRFEPIMRTAREQLLRDLSINEQLVFIDNASKIGSAWLSTLPMNNKHHTLSDVEISAAIQVRALFPTGATCAACGVDNPHPLHFEVCRQPPQLRCESRHNSVRDLLAKTIRDTNRRVTTEPAVRVGGNQRRADIVVYGANNVNAIDPVHGFADLKITNILTRETDQVRANIIAAVEDNAQPILLHRRAWDCIEAVLAHKVHEVEVHYARHADVRVLPLVMSSGGMVHKTFHQYIKSLVPCPKARRAFRVEASFILQRARAVPFHRTPEVAE